MKRSNKNILLGGGANPVAYCRLHHKTLTAYQMKQKGCLGKCCYHLVKNNEHSYWKEREKKRERKKMSRTSNKDLDAIKSVYEKGMKVKEISKLFNLSEETINKHLGIVDNKEKVNLNLNTILDVKCASMLADIEEMLDKKLGNENNSPMLTLKALGYIEDTTKEGTFYCKENGRPKKRITISKTNRVIGYSMFDEYKNNYSTPLFIDFRTIEAIYSYGCDLKWNGIK